VMRHLQLNYGALWNYDVALALARRVLQGGCRGGSRRRFVDRGPIHGSCRRCATKAVGHARR
jgi:hypothetical protein